MKNFKSLERLTSVLKNSQRASLICKIDSINMTSDIVYMNNSFQHLTGWKLENIQNQSLQRLDVITGKNSLFHTSIFETKNKTAFTKSFMIKAENGSNLYTDWQCSLGFCEIPRGYYLTCIVKPASKKAINKNLTALQNNESSYKSQSFRIKINPTTELITSTSEKLHEGFELCLKPEENKATWIHGEPGTGKISLAKAMIANTPNCNLQLCLTPYVEDLSAHIANFMAKSKQQSPEHTCAFLIHRIERYSASQIDFILDSILRLQKLKISARIIVTSNDLDDMSPAVFKLIENTMRKLGPLKFHLPPLRHRKDDIPLFLDSFINTVANKLSRPPMDYDIKLPIQLAKYSFKDNIRELKQMVFMAIVHSEKAILSIQDFDPAVSQQRPNSKKEKLTQLDQIMTVHFPEELPTLKECNHMLIKEALIRTGGNQGKAAHLLGISRQALNKRLHRFFRSKESIEEVNFEQN